MKKSTKYILISGGILLLGIVLYSPFGSNSSSQYDDFAQCLNEQGVLMYGTNWCSFCQKQKDEFGKSFQYVEFIDCDRNKDACLTAGVRGYPTWRIDGENYPGLQSLEKLSLLSGCELR